MKVSKAETNEKDKFGTERFAEIKAELDKFKLSKDNQRRLDKIITVFSYRRDVAYELHHASDSYPNYTASRIKERLDKFKPVQFFLDAMRTLLDDVKKEEIAKPVPVRRRYGY